LPSRLRPRSPRRPRAAAIFEKVVRRSNISAAWFDAGLSASQFINSNDGGIDIERFTPTEVLRLPVSIPGRYAVFGKVVLQNQDDTPQNSEVQMTSNDGQNIIDRGGVRIPGGGFGQSFSLEGELEQTQTDRIIDIRCATNLGTVTFAKLIALRVDINPDVAARSACRCNFLRHRISSRDKCSGSRPLHSGQETAKRSGAGSDGP
jgi:hypothetical protein